MGIGGATVAIPDENEWEELSFSCLIQENGVTYGPIILSKEEYLYFANDRFIRTGWYADAADRGYCCFVVSQKNRTIHIMNCGWAIGNKTSVSELRVYYR